MFRFIKKIFIVAINAILPTFVGCGALNAIPLKCVSMKNQECKVRPAMVNTNSNEFLFYPSSALVKCSGSCNDINNPYAKLCIPDVVKDINIKVFNLVSRNDETCYASWHKTCAFKRILDASVCYDNKHWNNDICRCECQELIDKGRCDNGFIWNPSVCACECNKSCDVGEFLDYV